ncbi:MAG: EipA family protein, partial [Sphingomonas sp.]
YMRRGNVVLIPIRLGVGWRQGVNVGYMKFSHKSRWFPL